MVRWGHAQFYAINRHAKTVTLLSGFSCWEHVRSAFYFGIIMPDNKPANGIGRYNGNNFAAAAAKSGLRLI